MNLRAIIEDRMRRLLERLGLIDPPVKAIEPLTVEETERFLRILARTLTTDEYRDFLRQLTHANEYLDRKAAERKERERLTSANEHPILHRHNGTAPADGGKGKEAI